MEGESFRSPKLGIVVPYRNREKHLKVFVPYIKEFLETRGLFNYELIVVEQCDERPFNRGALLNLGFLEAEKRKCNYVCFHDIDLLPEDGVRYDYFLDEPVELCTWSKKGVTYDYFGGVTLIPTKQFREVNGYSTEYEGWGFEDDDLLLRLRNKKLIQGEIILPLPRTYGQGAVFTGKEYLDLRSFSIGGNRPVVVVVDIIPGYPSERVGYEDMKAISLVTEKLDVSISYDRYGSYRFEVWDDHFEAWSIVTGKMPRYHCRCVGTLDFKENSFSLYINGNLIGKKFLPKGRSFYFDPRSIHVGCTKLKNSPRNSFFVGTILNAEVLGIRPGSEEEIGFERLSLQDLEEYPVATNVISFKEDLFSRYENSYTYIPMESRFSVTVPTTPTEGRFKALDHKATNKYDKEEVRKNQDRFYRVCRGELGSYDGLSTVRSIFNTESSRLENNVIWIKATRK